MDSPGPFNRSMDINRAKQCTQAACIKAQPRERESSEGWTNVWAIKSCRVAKTPSEFYLSSQPSFHLTAIGRESLATSVGFLSPSPSSGSQTLIGLDSGSLLSFQPSCPTKSSFPSSAIFLSLWPFLLYSHHFSSKGTLFLPLVLTSAGHVSNRLPR